MKLFTNLRRGIVASLAVAVLSISTNVANAQFRGGGVLYDISSACTDQGIPEVMPVTVRYRAMEIEGENSQFVIMPAWGVGAYVLRRNTPFVPTQNFQRVNGIGVWNGLFQDAVRPNIRIFTRRVDEPRNAPIGAAETVFFRMSIRHLYGITGCTAFAAFYVNREAPEVPASE